MNHFYVVLLASDLYIVMDSLVYPLAIDYWSPLWPTHFYYLHTLSKFTDSSISAFYRTPA